MSEQTEGDIAQLLLPQREGWSVCPGLWLFSGFLRDEYLAQFGTLIELGVL